ncbi:MAG: FAD-dependent oxidoreductase [Deltaproteobacteria bacterium]|nr:FAD-dependent oxidoreductase [Deltaproteobacteria bacterium]
MDNLIVYTKKGCPFCRKAVSFLKEKGFNYKEIEVAEGSKAFEEMRQKTGSSSLPQILLFNEALGGYSDLVYLYTTGELNKRLGLGQDSIEGTIYDVAIIGGGPSGLSAAIYAARKVLKTVLISKNIGGQVADTWEIDNFLGFSQIETSDLISKFNEHVDKYGIEKLEGVAATSLEISGKIKKVTADNGSDFLSKSVIIATGKRPRPLKVPGEKELAGKGVAYCSTCDAPLFAGADVAVIGGGNSALEAVLDLDKVANSIYLVSLTQITADQIIYDKVKNSKKVKIFTEYNTMRIIGNTAVEGMEIKPIKSDKISRLKVEGVFIEIGLLPNSDLILDILETNRQGEIIINDLCQTGVAGVFACGDVTSIPFKQVIIAAGEGAKAALSAYNYLINQR